MVKSNRVAKACVKVVLCASVFGALNPGELSAWRQQALAQRVPQAKDSRAATPMQAQRRLKVTDLWQTVEKTLGQGLSARRRFAANLHSVLTTMPEQQKSERAHVFAALSVLHASDPLFRQASLSFLAAAQNLWPEFTKTNEAVYVWNKFLLFMRQKQIVNEHLLSRAAALLGSGQVASAEQSEFPYYMGWSLFRGEKYADALSMLARVPLGSPHYRRAKFLEGTSQLLLGKPADARETFQIVVALSPTESEDDFDIPARSIQRLRDLAMVNIARILYEQGQFSESLAYYRAIDQDSHFFYESLSEQGWPFFMAGYPARALGAVYAATSPFYADRFNPDVYFLNAAIYHWLCQYAYARQALTQFIEHNKNDGDSLRVTLSGLQKLAPAKKRERLLAMLQTLNQGLSAKAYGLGDKTMAFLAGQEGLMDSFQGFVSLQNRRLRVQELELPRAIHTRIQTAIEEFEEELGSQVALQAEDALKGLLGDYESGLTQARLLWLEILMAEKDKVLGVDRGSQRNAFVADEKAFVESLQRPGYKSWKQDKNEFWFDELGNYVFAVSGQCKDSRVSGVSK